MCNETSTAQGSRVPRPCNIEGSTNRHSNLQRKDTIFNKNNRKINILISTINIHISICPMNGGDGNGPFDNGFIHPSVYLSVRPSIRPSVGPPFIPSVGDLFPLVIIRYSTEKATFYSAVSPFATTLNLEFQFFQFFFKLHATRLYRLLCW